MRILFIILFCLSISVITNSQARFTTIVPNLAVISGESFQVQYALQGVDKIENFKPPVFTHFRLVSGPNQYVGSAPASGGIQPVRNFVYTLQATETGKFKIYGAIATVNGRMIKSDDVVLEVISKEAAAKLAKRIHGSINPDYLLFPGEDPFEKIRKNLFLKLSVDKTTCYAGEPVLAVFKLYSRLESNSDIVKNPGFYGFTVYDRVNLADKQSKMEIVNGNPFEVHTIREVLLYPLQPGTFTIDAMEIMNKVEFPRTVINKKMDQKIVEGILGNPASEETNKSAELFETRMQTDPVIIKVNPLPARNKPLAFTGAVGSFSIIATIAKNEVARNEEGIFDITVTGQGNFTQLNAPVLNWPDGIEGFEPAIIDSLDKTGIALSGSRKFRYAFVCSTPGHYDLPAVHFSFFDPGAGKYQTVSANTTAVEIIKEENKNTIPAEKRETISEKNARASRVAGGIIILLVAVVLAYWLLHKNVPGGDVGKERVDLTTDPEVFTPLKDISNLSNKEFCSELHRFIWNYVGQRLGLDGSAVNKDILFLKLGQEKVEDALIVKLKKVLSGCELGLFAGATIEINKVEMLAETKEVLSAISKSESSG